MDRGAVSVDAGDRVMPVPVIDVILRNRDALEDGRRRPFAWRVAAYEQHALASVRIRDTQYCQARVKDAVRADVVDQRRWGIGGCRQVKTHEARDRVGSAPCNRDAIFGKSLPGPSSRNILRVSGIRAKRSGTGQCNTRSVIRDRGRMSSGRESKGCGGEVDAWNTPTDLVITRRGLADGQD